jgi:hemerythrin-like domain-containing protein
VAKKSINQLKAEHQRILQALDVLREMTEQIQADGTVAREDVLDLLEFFECFAHEYHDRKEHCLLLPVVAEPRGAAAEAAFVRISSDHSRMHEALDALRAAQAEGTNARFLEAADTYIELLTTHIFTEDRFIFATMEKTLSDAGDDELLKAFSSFEPNLRDYSRAKFETVVPRLAQKYSIPQCV